MSWGPLRPAGAESAGAAGFAKAAASANPANAANAAHPSDPARLRGWPETADTLAQARQVFLASNQLPARWAGRARFAVLDTAFGGGHKFLATWAAWQQDSRRSDRLCYLAIEPQPPQREALVRLHTGSALADLASELTSELVSALASELAAAWPPLTPDLHVIDLAGGRVRLLLALGDIATVLPEWIAQVDAIYLDGPAAEPGHAAWDARRLRRLPRLAAAGATLAARSAAPALRAGLAAAGFEWRPPPAVIAATSATAATAANTATSATASIASTTATVAAAATDAAATTAARFAPRFKPPAPPGRQPPTGVRTVAVIGAGLAGAAVARALAALGLAVQVFDRRDGPARETSGNPGGLFHGIVHGHDGPHARWLRSAALRAEQVLRPLVDSGQVDGAVAGLLRGAQDLDRPAMQAQLERLGLPPDYVQAWPDALPGGDAAWFYPGGGWVAPATLCAQWLAGPGITTHFGTGVQALLPHGRGWQLRGTDSQLLASVDAVVLCNATDSGRLLANLAPARAPAAATADADASSIDQPLHTVRGQVTWLSADTPGLPAMPLPVAATGYALRLADGRLLCGASAQSDRPGSLEEPLRDADHAHNLATLRRLTGWTGEPGPGPLAGRVGWRLQSADRLPLLGPVPASWAGQSGTLDSGGPARHPPQAVQAAASAATACATDASHAAHAAHAATAAQTAHGGRPRLDQARHVPRLPGLYLFTALGSRGITHAALGGEVLAAWITGDPMPAPASLLDALDPARFIVRQARRPA